MSRGTRSHHPDLLKIGSDDEIVHVTESTAATPERTTRRGTRKRPPSESFTEPSATKRAKTTQSPSKTNLKKKNDAPATSSPASTRRSVRERSAEILMPTPRKTRRSGPVDEEEEETEENTRSTIPDSVQPDDPFAFPESSPEKPARKSNRLSGRSVESGNDKAVKAQPVKKVYGKAAEAKAAASLFGRKSGDKASRAATSARKEINESPPPPPVAAAKKGELKRNQGAIQSSSGNHPSKVAAPANADAQGEKPKKVEKRGRKPKQKPPGWEPTPKRSRGRPKKYNVEPEGRSSPAAPEQEEQADADDEGTDDAVVVREDDGPAPGLADKEADEGLVIEDSEDEEREDIVEKTHFHSVTRPDGVEATEDSTGSEYEDKSKGGGTQLAKARSGKGSGAKSKSTRNQKRGQKADAPPAPTVHDISRRDAAGTAQRTLYRRLDRYAKKAAELHQMYETFFEESKEAREELFDSHGFVENAFNDLVDALDTKGTYGFTRPLNRQYTIEKIGFREVPHLPGDPFGAYGEGFDPTDERVKKLFKNSEERNADMDLLEDVRRKIEGTLNDFESNLEVVDKIIAVVDRPVTLFTNKLHEAEDLVYHESYFPREYQVARVRQAERIKEVSLKRRKLNGTRLPSSQSMRDTRRRRTTEAPRRGRSSSFDSVTNEIDAAMIERVSIPAFGSRDHDAPSTQNGRRQAEKPAWTKAEDQTLLVGIDQWGLDRDIFIMIKQTYGSETGSVLYNRQGSELQARALEIKKIILEANGELPASWVNI